MKSNYAPLIEKIADSHAKGRAPSLFCARDVAIARLYCHAFRLHTIGTFHATRVALLARPRETSASARQRAIESLEDLANIAMDDVPTDFRAAVSMLHRYHSGIERVTESLKQDCASSNDLELERIAARFQSIVNEIRSSNGIHLTRDTGPQQQASFVVPSLGITIVPLVYGDRHSWNLAYLDGERSDVPFHQHHQGVEIHLGYSPLHGYTVLGDEAAEVSDGYAMPIPPMTRHGYTNDSAMQHHVPFIFGSLLHGGWGVFLDVEPQPMSMNELKKVSRDSESFRNTIDLEREIETVKTECGNIHRTLIASAVTDRGEAGGLELSISKITGEWTLPASESFRAISVVHGSGIVEIAGEQRVITHHDHFALPGGMSANFRSRNGAMVLLDAQIRRA